jgi:CubicO group peptidase (beta-lactamase class C family)
VLSVRGAPIEAFTRLVPRSCLAVALAVLSLTACGPAGFRGGVSPGALERAANEPPTGAAGPGLERFDALIQNILERSGIPGASLAMARGGRLVLARGYGLADVATGERVQPQTRFVLASVSKAITAVTVLKLVQEGRLSLEATVLPFLAAGESPVDPRWQVITVEMLLRHEGGGIAARAAIRSPGTSASREPCTSAVRSRRSSSRGTCSASHSTSRREPRPSTPTSATCCSG